MDDARPKCTKITIRAEFDNGSTAELEAIEPTDATYEAVLPDPDYNFGGIGGPDRTIAKIHPPTVTLRFTASEKHGMTEQLTMSPEVAAAWTSMFPAQVPDDAMTWIAPTEG